MLLPRGALLDKLNFGVLAALEVDTDFNVNILTGSSGKMMGGLGGGPDVAAGADISIVCLPVLRGRTPVDHQTGLYLLHSRRNGRRGSDRSRNCAESQTCAL